MFFILCFFAFFVTVSHAYFLRRAQMLHEAPREVREKLWKKHTWWNGTLWTLLFLAIVVVEYFLPRHVMAPQPYVGAVFFIVGLVLVVWSRLILGRAGAMGVRWFLPETAPTWQSRGSYRFLGNPMYDGFILVFIGSGLLFGSKENFYLAILSFVLLNLFLARI